MSASTLLETLSETRVTALAHRAPVLTSPDATLGEVVAAMAKAGRGAAVAVDGRGVVCGIFTEHDLAHRVDLSDAAWRAAPVSAWMNASVAVVEEGASIAVALAAMHEGAHRNLPLVDDADRVTGLISARDILAWIAGLFPEEFVNLPPDPAHEATDRWGG
jgi:CBS domain-containing protein